MPRCGPSGCDSQAWMSRALQSLSATSPKMWSSACSTGTGSPCARRSADHEPELDLDVEPRARPVLRAAAGAEDLAARPAHRRTADDDRRRAPVVADRHPLPVRRQRIAVGAQHPPAVLRRDGARRRSRRSRRRRTAARARRRAAGASSSRPAERGDRFAELERGAAPRAPSARSAPARGARRRARRPTSSAPASSAATRSITPRRRSARRRAAPRRPRPAPRIP